MEENKLGKEPAFPFEANRNNGMSKRLYLAGLAMQGMLANQSVTHIPDEIVIKTAYKLADELLKQENDD